MLECILAGVLFGVIGLWFVLFPSYGWLLLGHLSKQPEEATKAGKIVSVVIGVVLLLLAVAVVVYGIICDPSYKFI